MLTSACIPSKALLDSSAGGGILRSRHKLGGTDKGRSVQLDLPTMIRAQDRLSPAHGGWAGSSQNRSSPCGASEAPRRNGEVKATTEEQTRKAKRSSSPRQRPIERPGLSTTGSKSSATPRQSPSRVPKKLLVVGGGTSSGWGRCGIAGGRVLVIEFTEGILPLMDQELSGCAKIPRAGMKFRSTRRHGAQVKDRRARHVKSGIRRNRGGGPCLSHGPRR